MNIFLLSKTKTIEHDILCILTTTKKDDWA